MLKLLLTYMVLPEKGVTVQVCEAHSAKYKHSRRVDTRMCNFSDISLLARLNDAQII